MSRHFRLCVTRPFLKVIESIPGLFAWRDSVKQLKRNEDFSYNLWGFSFNLWGFPLTSRGLVPVAMFCYTSCINKAIEDGNQTCSPPFLLGLVGRMTYLNLTLNIKLAFWMDNAKTRNFVLGPTKYESLKSTVARNAIHRVTEKLHKPTKNHNTRKIMVYTD